MAGFLFLNISCGLDTFVVIDAPDKVWNVPNSETIDNAYRYFEFETKETSNNMANNFKGTDIYYKIYSNASVAESEASVLGNLSNNEETAASAPSKLIDSYSYKILRASNPKKNSATLIPAAGSNQRVRIRLSNYNDQEDYRAQITVDGNFLNGTDISVPLRFEDEYNFDFGRFETDEKSKVPLNGDVDVKYSENFTKDGVWYVNLFAIGVAFDAAYTSIYSNILFLGTVIIDQNELYN